MGKQKLINSIKKDVIKEIKTDIKDSVVKEMFVTSKKVIKKMKKQILKELQEEMFAETKVSKNRKNKNKKNKRKELSSTLVETNLDDIEVIKNSAEEAEENKSKDDVEVVSPYEEGQVYEYKGFKFDVGKMSSIVTGKYRNKSNENTQEKTEKTSKSETANPSDELQQKVVATSSASNFLFTKCFNSKKTTEKDVASTNFPELSSTNMVPSIKKLVKVEENLTPYKKEEIAFFIGKLKEGVDSLGKGEKNINYRKKKGGVYTFSYSKYKVVKDDFRFKFNLDLNLYTLGVKINTFEFNIDGFNFDKGFVEILDIIALFDVIGMSLIKYIYEISGINSTASECNPAIKENIKKNIKYIKANTKLEKVIFDERILKILRSNGINTYGQLKKIEEFTSIRGVEAKMADKIEGFITK